MKNELNRHCQPCEGNIPALSLDQIQDHLKSLPEWNLNQESQEGKGKQESYIFRDYKFKNYYQTIAFVNAVAWVSHQENHHPELLVNYNHCRVKYWTHAIGGLSENDFICARRIDELEA